MSTKTELELFKLLLNQIPDLLFVKDVDCRFILANTAIASSYGFSDGASLIGKTDFDLHSASLAQAFFDTERTVMAEGVPMLNLDESFVDASGVKRSYSTSKIPLRNQADEVIGLLGIGRDVTDRKRLETMQFEQGLILEMIAKNVPVPLVMDRLVLFAEAQTTGLRGCVLLLDGSEGTLHFCAAPSFSEDFHRITEGVGIGPNAGTCGTAAYRRETVVVTDTFSDPLWDAYRDIARRLHLRACWSTPIVSHEGAVLGTFALYSDIARAPDQQELNLMASATRIAGIAIERQQSEDRMKFVAHHDGLTGLPNRLLLQERLVHTLLCAAHRKTQVFVILIDLDNFKLVNDGLGHLAGDTLLKAIATRMRRCITGADTVARTGGDEFVVLLSDQADGRQSVFVALERLQSAITEPIEIDGRPLQITCSIGIATYPHDGTDANTLLINADAAMYSAKDAGRDKLKFYTAKMNAKIHERLALRECLRHAIARSEFSLVYQPQVELRSRRIFAVEALLRWHHPEFGIVSPTTFIPIAEESGLIVSIGDWALREACRQNKAWQDAGCDAVTVAVNVSARQFDERGWTTHVEHALQSSGLAAQYLELEVTESMLMHDVPRAIATMLELRQRGVKFAIDDFGTGFSSLSALKRFPVSRLKIDKSFVRDLSTDDNDKAIASAVISMGHDLGMRIIAEGVEDDAQLAILMANGCDEVQGFLFGAPATAETMQTLLTLTKTGCAA